MTCRSYILRGAIDANSVAKIQFGKYRSAGKQIRKIAKPSFPANKRGYLGGAYYYNESALEADDEDRSKFDLPPVVIDVYRISDGSHSHSFYLSGHNGGKLTNFAVQGNGLIGMADTW